MVNQECKTKDGGEDEEKEEEDEEEEKEEGGWPRIQDQGWRRESHNSLPPIKVSPRPELF